MPVGEEWEYWYVGEADGVEPGVLLVNRGRPYYDNILEHTIEVDCVRPLDDALTWKASISVYQEEGVGAEDEANQAERDAATVAYRAEILKAALDEFDRTL